MVGEGLAVLIGCRGCGVGSGKNIYDESRAGRGTRGVLK